MINKIWNKLNVGEFHFIHETPFQEPNEITIHNVV